MIKHNNLKKRTEVQTKQPSSGKGKQREILVHTLVFLKLHLQKIHFISRKQILRIYEESLRSKKVRLQ